jgi:hypothetical protein
MCSETPLATCSFSIGIFSQFTSKDFYDCNLSGQAQIPHIFANLVCKSNLLLLPFSSISENINSLTKLLIRIPLLYIYCKIEFPLQTHDVVVDDPPKIHCQ